MNIVTCPTVTRTELRVITDYRQAPAPVLPVGFRLDDRCGKVIRLRYAKKDGSLTHENLRAMFPGEPALKINKP